MTGHQYLSPADRQKGIDNILDHLRGGRPLASIIEDYPSLDFAQLEGEVKGLIKSATPDQRQTLHFRLALLRSLRYSVASAKHCAVLGAVNGVRELYEGQRLLQQLPNAS